MHYHRRRGWEMPESRATPEHVFLNRRQWLAASGAATFNSRSAPRRTMEGQVSISDGELTVVAEASDLSRTGIAVHAVPRRLEPGEMVSLQITFRAHPDALRVERAEVMWARKDTAGLRFLDLSPAARATLETLTTHA